MESDCLLPTNVVNEVPFTSVYSKAAHSFLVLLTTKSFTFSFQQRPRQMSRAVNFPTIPFAFSLAIDPFGSVLDPSTF